jgi:peptidoglycan/LPS O-acetylase OafA/YrhL
MVNQNQAVCTLPMDSRKHIPALDGVRGIAILMVMSHHFAIVSNHTPLQRLVGGCLEFGWAGVDLFFVLSGFLITGILLDSKNGEQYFRNFYIRRCLRIFPLYYVFVLTTFVALPCVDGELAHLLSHTEGGIGWYLAYLSNFRISQAGRFGFGMLNVTWSLAIEEQFYLVWPIVVYALNRRALMTLCVALVLGAPAIRLMLVAQSASWVTVYVMPYCRVDPLACGALVALLTRTTVSVSLLSRFARLGILLGAASLAVTLIMNPGRHPAVSNWMLTLGFSGLAWLFASALLLLLLSSQTASANRLCSSRTLVYLGNFSYGLYLVHVPVRNTLIHVVPQFAATGSLTSQLAFGVAALVVSCVIALVLRVVIERPCLKLKAHFYSVHVSSSPADGCDDPVKEVSVSSLTSPGSARGAN